jgi:carbon storage regulator CsrA
MLVLSRNTGDGISFPDLDLVIEILKVQGKRVQIGVSAADSIRVLRSELMEREKTTSSVASSEERHQLRNELNTLSMGLALAEKHLQRGDTASAESALRGVVDKLQSRGRTSQVGDRPATVVSERAAVWNAPGSPRPGKILIVEDNPNESRLLAEILSLNGFEVETALDGHRALEWLDLHTPDVILMDMHMQGCDGPTTIERIRQIDRLQSVPILAVTGATRDEIAAEHQRPVEVQDWFQKPVHAQPLMHAIDGLVAQALDA